MAVVGTLVLLLALGAPTFADVSAAPAAQTPTTTQTTTVTLSTDQATSLDAKLADILDCATTCQLYANLRAERDVGRTAYSFTLDGCSYTDRITYTRATRRLVVTRTFLSNDVPITSFERAEPVTSRVNNLVTAINHYYAANCTSGCVVDEHSSRAPPSSGNTHDTTER